MSEPAAPKLKPHHGYRSWTSTWWEGPHRRTRRFGREGVVSGAEARAKFKTWLVTDYEPTKSAGAILTVPAMCDLYEKHARSAFAGSAHLSTILSALKALKIATPGQVAATFKSHQLSSVRDGMIWAVKIVRKKKVRVARSIKTVNGRLFAMKQAFVWAATERGLIPEGVAGAMMMVQPLKRGRSEAKEPKKIQPVKWSHVQDAMNASPQVLRDMIELQWLTGMRSGELVMMTPAEIDRAHVYRPRNHKMERAGGERSIPLGPRAWKIVARYAHGLDPGAFLFSPKVSVEQMLTAKNAKRSTPISCGNRRGSNVKRHAFIKPGEHYTPASYRRAIRYACTRAGVPRWHPHQVRHAFGTRVRERFNFESASNALGHGAPAATVLYAEKSLKVAAKVARKIG